ncbi:MAG: mercuric reductase [Pirellulales bacterium]
MKLSPRDSHDDALAAQVHPPDWVNPTPTGRYNLVAIGGGTAGLVSAIGAASLGAKVALIESRLLGGDCLNTGCVPSKALIRSSRAAHEQTQAAALGFAGSIVGDWDFAAVMDRVRGLRAQISHHDSAERLRSLGVEVFFGDARFTSGKTLDVAGQTLEFRRAVICTGTRPIEPRIAGISDVGYLTNETVFSLCELPRRLFIIGAGPIGCELAQAFCRLGSEVHLINDQERLLPKEDECVQQLIAARFAAEGIHLHLGWGVMQAQQLGSAKTLLIGRGAERQELIGDEVLVAVGRRPNIDSLELAAARVESNLNGVQVNDFLQTTNPRIYAAGDVCTTARYTHAAYAMAMIVLRNSLLLGRQRYSRLVIPRTTFTEPEVAHVGLTAAEAAKRGIAIDTYRVDMAEVDRAVVDGRSEGFVAVHTRRGKGAVLGASIVAPHAGEMIGELTMLIQEKRSLATLARTIHVYPTVAEALTRVALEYQRSRLTPRVQSLVKKWLAWRR